MVGIDLLQLSLQVVNPGPIRFIRRNQVGTGQLELFVLSNERRVGLLERLNFALEDLILRLQGTVLSERSCIDFVSDSPGCS